MTSVMVFEELRFLIELILAEHILLWPFTRRKPDFLKKMIIGNVLLMLLAVSYILPRNYISTHYMSMIMTAVAFIWYLMLTILTVVLIKVCYVITFSDAIFISIAGYSIQHIEYIFANEVIAQGVAPDMPKHLLQYILFCVATCAIWYYIIYRIFSPKLKECQRMLYRDQPSTILNFLLVLLVLFISTFICQDIFHRGLKNNLQVWFQGAVTDFFSCILIIIVQFSIIRINTLNREKEIVQQLLYERRKQYQLSKENIDIINRKCHDLKHQINALRQADSKELDKYINEVEESILIYDNVVKTENEVLNTILSEKSLYCEKHQIKLTCIIDSSQLDFMSTLDIYALLGNALDNAIECVRKYPDKDKRVISLTISAKGSFLCIQMNNYFDGELTIVDGLPITTKSRKEYHGFGMRSMRHLAEKYGGTLCTEHQEGVFLLQIVIPMPPEFLRLLRESK